MLKYADRSALSGAEEEGAEGVSWMGGVKCTREKGGLIAMMGRGFDGRKPKAMAVTGQGGETNEDWGECKRYGMHKES